MNIIRAICPRGAPLVATGRVEYPEGEGGDAMLTDVRIYPLAGPMDALITLPPAPLPNNHPLVIETAALLCEVWRQSNQPNTNDEH